MVAVAWDGWRLGEDDAGRARGLALAQFAVDGTHVLPAFESALRAGHGHVIVSRGDFRARADTWMATARVRPASPPTSAEPPGRLTHGEAMELVARIWRELVSVADPARDVDLYDIGGSSLTLLRIRSRLRSEAGIDVPLGALVSRRTIDAMAGLIAGDAAARSPETALPPAHAPIVDAQLPALESLLRGIERST